MSKHTPGPWEISRYTNYVGFSVHAHGAGCIAERWWPTELTEGFNEEVKANANLIAAAPDLLEAVLALQKRYDSDMIVENSEDDLLWNRIYAAIAKAEGTAGER